MLTDRAAAAALATNAPRRAGPWWWLAPPLVLAVLGGWLLLRNHGLWYDEVYTAEVAPVPLGRLLRALAGGHGTIPYLRDAPPSYNAPYYAVAHLWLTVTRLPATEIGLRLFSLVSAVGAVAVFTRTVARLAADRRVALVAGLVAATNPFVVQYSAEARGYALALLAVSCAALGFARWLDGGGRWALWLYGTGVAVAGLAHWFALLVAVGFAVAAVVLRRRDAAGVVAVTAAAAAPTLVLIGIALGNGVGASGAEWLRGVGGNAPWLTLRAWSGRYPPLLVVTVVAAGAGLAVGARHARVVAAAWVGAPVVLMTAGELVRPVFVDRYLLAATLGLAVLVALGVTRLRGWTGVGAAAAVLALSVVSTAIEVNRPPKDDTRSAVALVAGRHVAGEPVVAAARWDALGVDHYVRVEHPALRRDLVLPGAPIPASTTVWVVRRAAGGVKGDPRKLDDLDRELAGRRLRVTEEVRFDGRYADTLVQRWDTAPAR
ncbi:MAG: hypothetical protein ACRD2W_16685 [Acidimicrobiales bacterium]